MFDKHYGKKVILDKFESCKFYSECPEWAIHVLLGYWSDLII